MVAPGLVLIVASLYQTNQLCQRHLRVSQVNLSQHLVQRYQLSQIVALIKTGWCHIVLPNAVTNTLVCPKGLVPSRPLPLHP